MDSLDRGSNGKPVLEGTPNVVGAPLEKGIPVGGPSNVDKIGEGSPSRVVAASILSPRPVDTIFSRRRPPDQVLLSKS